MSADSLKVTALIYSVERKHNMDQCTVPPVMPPPTYRYMLEVVGRHNSSYPTRISMVNAYRRYKILGVLCRMYIDGKKIHGFYTKKLI